MTPDAGLGAALERGHLHLDYLPVVGLRTGEVEGVEALLRLDPGSGPVLLPATFLAGAERSGAMIDVGRWVIDTGLAELASVPRRPDEQPLRLSVNVTYGELVHPDLPAAIQDALTRTGHPAQGLCLEISEETLAKDVGAVAAALNDLRQIGIRLAVDDFGTGTSSLSLVQSLPVDELKIDRSFVARMHEDPKSAAIARAVVSLARSLELKTTAEGVELETQERMLVGLRCTSAQGWLYARPASSAAAAVAAVDGGAIRCRTHDAAEALWSGLGSARTAARIVEHAFEHAPIGMALIDGTGTHLAVNPALSALLGVPQADLVGGSCWDAVHPEDVRLDQARLDAVLRGELSGYLLEERYVDTEGEAVWVEVTVGGLPERAPDDGTVRLLRQVRCIEDRRQAEHRRLELERLNGRLIEQAGFLADANERLAGFASTLSHDLQQPLVALRGFLDLLVHRADRLDSDGASWLEAASRSAGKLSDAIQALRANAQGTPVELTVVDLGEVFDEARDDLAAELREADAEIDLGPLPAVVGDRAMLGRVAANLLANAIRYRDDSRRLHISIHFRGLTDDGAVVVVADNGLGIAPDELDAVFTPGHRGSAATGKAGSGTGLAIVRSVIANLDGRAWAEVGDDSGARICLALPPAGSVSRHVVSAAGGIRVALIDDSEDVREVVSAVLAADGIQVVGEAGSAEAARRVATECAANVVVVDQALGDGEGIPLIPWMKAKGAVVILMSGAMSLSMQRDAMAHGADAAIDKGNLLQLAELIRDLAASAPSQRIAVTPRSESRSAG